MSEKAVQRAVAGKSKPSKAKPKANVSKQSIEDRYGPAIRAVLDDVRRFAADRDKKLEKIENEEGRKRATG